MAKDDASRMGEQIRMRKKGENGVCVRQTQSELAVHASALCSIVAASYTTRQSGSFVEEETERSRVVVFHTQNFFLSFLFFISGNPQPKKMRSRKKKNREKEKGKLDFITLLLHGLKNEMPRMMMSQG